MIEDRISNLKGRSTEIMQSSEHHDMFGRKINRASGTCGTCPKYKVHVIWTQEGLARESETKKIWRNKGQKTFQMYGRRIFTQIRGSVNLD